MRCLEQAKDCARKMKDKFSESECFHCIGKVRTLILKKATAKIIQRHQTYTHLAAHLVTHVSSVFRPQVQLSLGDFVAARRSLKEALKLGSQQRLDRQAVLKAFKHGEELFVFVHSVFVCTCLHLFFLMRTAELMALYFSIVADKGCKLEEELGEDPIRKERSSSHQAVGLAEQLGDLCCKVGCYSKALDAYQAQVKNISCRVF